MRQYARTLALLACLVAFCNVAESRSLVKREANGGHVNTLAHGHVCINLSQIITFQKLFQPNLVNCLSED
jgi:hypothetical protein